MGGISKEDTQNAGTPFRFSQSRIQLEKQEDGLTPMFSKAKVYVLYTGPNRNGSIFTEEFVKDYIIPSMYGIPIVGEYIENKKDFGGHGGKVIISDDGVEFVVTTKPWGFVPESAEIGWENVIEKDGTVRSYLVTSAILWTGKYPEAYRVIEDSNNQSLELHPPSIDGTWGEMEPSGEYYFTYTKGQMSGLCILGQDVEPCFESSRIGAFSLQEETASPDYLASLEAMKEAYSFFEKQISIEVDNTTKIVPSFSTSEKDFFQKIALDKKCNFLVAEGYLLVEEGYEKNSSARKFLHHTFADGKMVVDNRALQRAVAEIKRTPEKYRKNLEGILSHLEKHGINTKNFSQGGNKNLLTLKNVFEAINVFDAEANEYKFEYSVVKFSQNEEDKTVNVLATNVDGTWFAIKLNEDMTIATKEETSSPLFDLTEVTELQTKFEELSSKLESTMAEFEGFKSERADYDELKEFKATVEKTRKESLVEKFALILDSTELEEVKSKLDEFSYEELEAKLALNAVRNKDVFAKLTAPANPAASPAGEFSLENSFVGNDSSPAWTKLVK